MTHRPSWPFAIVLAATLALPIAPLPCSAQPAMVPGELIVKFRSGLAASRHAQVMSALPNARTVRSFDFIGAEQVRFAGLSTEAALATLAANPAVEYAEPNWVITADVVPNDSSFAQLWALRNTGQGGAYAGDDIKATQAWDLFTGDPELKIGVIDTGIDYTHPDLAGNIWTNPGEIPGNGIDDDGNGYVDDVHGYDVVNNDGDPMDDGFHGTHVAGTIGAVGNNNRGVTGVNWRCKLVAIKFMNALGVGSEADAIAGLQYAIAVGVKVTNDSWGNMPGGQALLDAINAAGAAGQLFICASGNNHWYIDAVPVYPACYASPYMLTVLATDGRDLMATYSNYGPLSVQLGAPGSNIYSCKPGNAYQALNGTSMAAPHVVGVAALAFGRFPHATNLRIRQLILDSVDPIPSLTGMVSTGGRLNAFKVLTNGDAIAPGRVGDLGVAEAGSSAIRLAWTATGDDSIAGQATRYDLRYSTAPIDSANFAAATPTTVTAPLPAGAAESFEVGGLAFSTPYYFAIVAIDDFGNPGRVSNIAAGATLGIPHVAISQPALTYTLAPGTIADPVIMVANSAAGRLDFSVPAPSPAPWLSAAPAAGRVPAGAALPLVVHLDATSLTAGTYNAIVQIASNDPAAATIDVPVALSVRDIVGLGPALPVRLALRLRSANPASRKVALELSLPARGIVEAAVFDVRGARRANLANGVLPAGVHTLAWEADDGRGTRVGPGVYFVAVRTPAGTLGQRVVIVE